MNICGIKLNLFILHLAAALSTGTAHKDHYARNQYVPQTAYLPRGSYQEEAEEPSTTEASKTFKIEVDVPQLIRSYLGLPEAKTRSDGERVDSQKFQLELKTPDFGQMWESFKNILRESTGGRIEGTYVEEAPGVFKSDTVVYPKNFHEGNLLKLLKLKAKMQGMSSKKSRRGMEWGGEYDQLAVLL